MENKESLTQKNAEMREKIRVGLELSFKKLVAYKKRNDGILVFSDHGKIVKIQAKDINL